jgi:hypothetical protein
MTAATTGIDLGLLRDPAGDLGATSIIAASLKTSRRLITSPDTYIEAQSPFDRHARIGIPQGSAEVDQKLFLSFLGTQVVEWSEFEWGQLKDIVKNLRSIFAGTSLKLPARIYILKSTGREEAAAAYTRHLDTIVLPANMVASLYAVPPGGDPLHPAQSSDYLAGIITHELFHILSKNNPDWRSDLYAEVGYSALSNSIVLPSDENGGASLRDLKITNPDAPLLNVAIDLVPPGGTVACAMVPALVSSGAYVGGEFFDTLNWIFLEVEKVSGVWQLRSEGCKPVIHKAELLKDQYLAIIGRNLTGELFHPDEILAQNFVIAAGEPSLGLLQRISSRIWPDRVSA